MVGRSFFRGGSRGKEVVVVSGTAGSSLILACVPFAPSRGKKLLALPSDGLIRSACFCFGCPQGRQSRAYWRVRRDPRGLPSLGPFGQKRPLGSRLLIPKYADCWRGGPLEVPEISLPLSLCFAPPLAGGSLPLSGAGMGIRPWCNC